MIAVNPNGDSVYVTNFGSVSRRGSVSVLDVATSSVTHEPIILGGLGPTSVTFAPDGIFAYVTSRNGNAVLGIDTGLASDNASCAAPNRAAPCVSFGVSAGPGPFGISIHPSGDTAYVTHSLPGLSGNAVSVIDLRKGTTLKEISVGTSPRGVVFTPDGALVLVANFGSASVSVIDPIANILVTEDIPVDAGPEAIAITPDGTLALVTNFNSATLSVIDIQSITQPGDAKVGAVPLIFEGTTFSNPRGIAITPDGVLAYVTISNSDRVLAIDTRATLLNPERAIVATINVGRGPIGVAVGPKRIP